MTELDERARRLVDAARAMEPTTADRARVRAALAARLGAGALSPEVPQPPPPAPIAAPAVPIAKALTAAALIGGIAFGAGLSVGRTTAPTTIAARPGLEAQVLRRSRLQEPRVETGTTAPRAPEAPPPTPKPAIVAERPRPLPPAPAPVDAPREPLAAAAPAPEPTAAPPRHNLGEETELLRRAEMALRAGDGNTALTTLDELSARRPSGVLLEERMAARVLALCAAGRTEEARREGERFVAARPTSIQAPRIRASCAFSGR
jgi:hypothetical protein